MDFKVKETRAEYNITQKEMSEILEIPLRTIENWESDKRKPSSWVKKLIIDNLKTYPHNKQGIITATKGFYTIPQIRKLLLPLTLEYDINRIILFGSYSKGQEDEGSDIDLVIDGPIKGLDFFGLLEEVTNLFVKQVDLILLSQIEINSNTYKEIMKGMILFDRKRS